MCIVGNVKLQSEHYVLQVGGEDDGLPDLIPQTNIKVEDDESDSIDKFFQQVSLRQICLAAADDIPSYYLATTKSFPNSSQHAAWGYCTFGSHYFGQV